MAEPGKVAEEMFAGEERQETAFPEIGLIVPQGQRHLVHKQDDTDGGEHAFDDGGWKVIGDHTQPQQPDDQLEQAGDDNR